MMGGQSEVLRHRIGGRPEVLRHSLYLVTTGFESSPTPSTLTVTRSPAVSGPMPAGVPVEMMSPGSSVITDEMKATSFLIGKINSRVEDDCRRASLTHPSTPSPSGLS